MTIVDVKAKVFPKDAVLKALDEWWAGELTDAQAIADLSEGLAEGEQSALAPLVEIDSHRAVRALLSIEEILGMEIPESVIKSGGYSSFDEMREALMPKLEARFAKVTK